MKTLRERCLECAAKNTPKHIEIKFITRLDDSSVWSYNGFLVLHVLKPTTRNALLVYLHECFHVHLEHINSDLPSHIKEYQATTSAVKAMRDSGIPIPRKTLQRANRYMKEYLDRDVSRNTPIDKTVVMYLKSRK